MESLTKSRIEILKEINDLNIQIESNTRLMNDYRLMQTGDFDRNEIKRENEELKKERNQLLLLI